MAEAPQKQAKKKFKNEPVVCSVCKMSCNGQRGFASHIRHRCEAADEAHLSWKLQQERLRWADKIEDEDYVRCRECGFRATTLGTHLRIHGLTAPQYRTKYPGALIRSRNLKAKRAKATAKTWKEDGRQGAVKGSTKHIKCPDCGTEHEVSMFLAPGMHETRCPRCRATAELKRDEDRWNGKMELEDFVVCRECGHHAENLTSHLQSKHPDLVGRYTDVYEGAWIVALNSAVRDKSLLKGRSLSKEVRAKMSQNAGRWNKGHTKHTHLSVASQAEKMKGQPSWNIGLTKETHPSIQSTSKKLKEYVGNKRPWDNGIKVTLKETDLSPFMTDGEVSIGAAIVGLGYSYPTIRKECKRLDVPIRRSAVSQTVCCDSIRKLLRDAEYKPEWNDPRFTNPKTGRRFRYDGFFVSNGLVVEFHGYQHWTFPSVFFPYEDLRPEWEAMLERDRLKQELIEQTEGLIYLCVRDDEPFWDLDHLRVRLKGVGISV